MKKIAAAALLTALATPASAIDFGIGLSAKSDDSWIYFPIEITRNFRIEPSVRITSSELQLHREGEQFGVPVTTHVQSESDQRQYGLGIFGIVPVKESVRIYYGVRAAYIEGDSETRQVTRFEFPSFPDEQEFESSLSTDGYRVAPAIGFEYFFNEHFSIGAEAEWFYQEVDQDEEFLEEISTIEQETNGTDTHLIIRYRF